MGRIKRLLISMISICMLLVSCAPNLDDGYKTEILSPNFVAQTSSRNLRVFVDSSQISNDWEFFCKYYMYMIAPPISDFECRNLSDGDYYTVDFLEKKIPLYFSFLDDGRYLFEGISEEDGLFFQIILDPVSKTYDYLQVMLISDSSGMMDQIISIGGDGISLYDGHNSKGKINVVSRNDFKYSGSGNNISIGECEFYTSEILEAAIQYTSVTYGDNVESFFEMPFTIETGKELYKYYFENDPGLEPTHKRDLFYIHDKINNKYDAHPGDYSSYDDPLTCLDDTLNFAKKLDPEWTPVFN